MKLVKLTSLLWVIGSMLFSLNVWGQKGSDMIDPDEFNEQLFISLLKEKLADFRISQNADTLVYVDVLNNAAKDQSEYMSISQRAETTQEDKKKATTALRIASYGGTQDLGAIETVLITRLKKGKTKYTYDKVVKNIVAKWKKSKETRRSLMESKFIYGGVSVVVNTEKKVAFVSHIMGTKNAINGNIALRKEIPAPYSTKSYGLKPYDEVECEEVSTFKYGSQLQSGLEVKDGKVMMTYNDLGHLTDLFINSKDGFAVDIVQREQYTCDKGNIMDNGVLSKGVMLTPVYSKKIFTKNTGGEETLELYIKKLPKKLLTSAEYEMNLLIIKNKHVCKTITRSFVEIADENSKNAVDILPDTVEILPDTLIAPGQQRYKVGYEDKVLDFIIPFEYSKYTYKARDMQPFIEALDEPHFMINGVTIEAHSSLEGDDRINLLFQKRRATSIVRAMERFQNKGVNSKIVYDDSWNMFKDQVKGTEFEALGNLTKKQVRKKFWTNRKLRKKIEPLLAKERFAKISIHVTVDDIQGMSEEKYLRKKMNSTIEESDEETALKTQRFIIENVLKGNYEYKAIIEQKFPFTADFASLIVNQIWAEVTFINDGKVTPEIVAKFDTLYYMAPENPYAKFNKVLCELRKREFADKDFVDSLQNMIDELYNTIIPSRIVNGLNLEFQFGQLAYLEKIGKLNKITLAKSINKIKKSFDPKEVTWKMALRVATLFGKHKYYSQALRALEPFVKDLDMNSKNVNEEMLFTYIIISAQASEGNYSKSFRDALFNASKLNPRRYCNLFGEPYLTFQMLDDPIIKNSHCKVCEGASFEDEGEEEEGDEPIEDDLSDLLDDDEDDDTEDEEEDE